MDNRIVIYQNYTKTSSFIDVTNPIARFVASSNTYYFVSYLLVVRPMKTILAVILHGPVVALSYQSEWMMREGNPYSSIQFSADMQKQFVDACNIPLQLSSYRHVASYYARLLQYQSSNHSVLASLHTSAGHSERTGLGTYGRDDELFAEDRACTYDSYYRSALLWHRYLQLIPAVVATNV